MTSTTSLSLIFFFFKLRASCIITHPLEAIRAGSSRCRRMSGEAASHRKRYITRGSSTEISCFVVSVRMQIWDISFHEKSRKRMKTEMLVPYVGNFSRTSRLLLSSSRGKKKVSACWKLFFWPKLCIFFFFTLRSIQNRTITTKKKRKEFPWGRIALGAATAVVDVVVSAADDLLNPNLLYNGSLSFFYMYIPGSVREDNWLVPDSYVKMDIAVTFLKCISWKSIRNRAFLFKNKGNLSYFSLYPPTHFHPSSYLFFSSPFSGGREIKIKNCAGSQQESPLFFHSKEKSPAAAAGCTIYYPPWSTQTLDTRAQ